MSCISCMRFFRLLVLLPGPDLSIRMDEKSGLPIANIDMGCIKILGR